MANVRCLPESGPSAQRRQAKQAQAQQDKRARLGDRNRVCSSRKFRPKCARATVVLDDELQCVDATDEVIADREAMQGIKILVDDSQQADSGTRAIDLDICLLYTSRCV